MLRFEILLKFVSIYAESYLQHWNRVGLAYAHRTLHDTTQHDSTTPDKKIV